MSDIDYAELGSLCFFDEGVSGRTNPRRIAAVIRRVVEPEIVRLKNQISALEALRVIDNDKIADLKTKIAKCENREKTSCASCKDWNTQRNCDVCEDHSQWQ